MSIQDILCERCDGKNIKKDGVRETKNRGNVQRYKCKDCSHRFSIDDGFWKMKNHENKITSCMNMYYAGMSLRKIQEHMQMFAPKNSHYSTIYRWIVKYVNMISTLTDNIQIQSGQELMSDEMEYHRLGEQNWFVDVMDTETRFMVASDYGRTRSSKEIKSVMNNIKAKTDNQIKVVTTDGFFAYKKVVKSVFGWNNKLQRYNVLHNVVIASERGFNHPIERLHNSIRERTKVMRGFHGCMESASAIMKGYEIYYNFIRKHQGIDNKTPQEEAVPELALSTNKWLSLIKLSKT